VIVRDQASSAQIGADQFSKVGSGTHCLSEHVARGDMDNVEFFYEPLGLSAFARSGRTDKDQMQNSDHFRLG
jgi:hypothetical protein